MADGRARVSVGRLLRLQFRAQLDFMGLEWREHKGWLDSEFVVTGSDRQLSALQSFCEWVNQDTSS